MKKNSILLGIFFCLSQLSFAQTYNPPVISIDKMNVFYFGIDNFITIGSPIGWDKTTIVGQGCTILPGNSINQKIIRPTSIGQEAKIIVVVDGKPNTFSYRVKRIPDPIFKIGSGKNPMGFVEFKNSPICRVELENFDFDVRFSVISATVKFSGTGFPSITSAELKGNNLSGLSNYISRCGVGSTVTFTDIKVQGTDGIRTIDTRSYLLN